MWDVFATSPRAIQIPSLFKYRDAPIFIIPPRIYDSLLRDFFRLLECDRSCHTQTHPFLNHNNQLQFVARVGCLNTLYQSTSSMCHNSLLLPLRSMQSSCVPIWD